MKVVTKWTILAAILFLAPWAHGSTDGQCGNFIRVLGDVRYIPSKGLSEWQVAKSGDKICSGGRIATNSESRASFKLSDGEEIHVSPGTRLDVVALQNDGSGQKKKALMNLINGKVRANIPPDSYKSTESEFRVRSETAVAGVRGTQFVMDHSAATKTSSVTTISGEVEVGQPTGRGFGMARSQFVRAGQRTSAASGQPPSAPVNVPAEELQSIDESTVSTDSVESTEESSPVADATSEGGESTSDAQETTAESSEPTSSTESDRTVASEPSSTSSPSMISTDDLGPAPGDDLLGGSGGLLLQDPINQPLPSPIACEFCDERVVDGPARVLIRVDHGNQ